MTMTLASNYYISSYNGSVESDIIYFNIDPSPIPQVIYNRTVSKYKCLPAYTGGAIVPGNTRIFDSGGGLGSGTITINLKYLTNAKIIQLQTKFDQIARVIYYDYSTLTKYICSWESGQSLTKNPIEGSKTGCGVTINLIVIGVYT